MNNVFSFIIRGYMDKAKRTIFVDGIPWSAGSEDTSLICPSMRTVTVHFFGQFGKRL